MEKEKVGKGRKVLVVMKSMLQALIGTLFIYVICVPLNKTIVHFLNKIDSTMDKIILVLACFIIFLAIFLVINYVKMIMLKKKDNKEQEK